jgi:thiamine monophosphate synthase
MSANQKRQADLDQFNPAQFDVTFSSESDVSMVQSVQSRDDHKADKKMIQQMQNISDLMRRIDTQLALKDKLLESPVRLANLGSRAQK